MTDAAPCGYEWAPVPADAAVELPYFAQHGAPADPHRCRLAPGHDAVSAHVCRCGRFTMVP